MNHKRILNGIAALLTVGMFYTFAFTMVQDVNEEDIASNHFYTEKNEAPEADANAEIITENITLPADSKGNAGQILPVPGFKAPSRLTVPDVIPTENKLISYAPILNTPDLPDDISDNNYFENKDIDILDLSDEELDTYFPEEDDVDEYSETSARVISSKNKAESDSESISSDSEGYSGSGSITADDINSGKLFDESAGELESDDDDEAEFIIEEDDPEEAPSEAPIETAASEEAASSAPAAAVHVESVQPDVPSQDYSFNQVVASSGTTVTAAADISQGEVFTAKVHGEIQEFDAFELTCMIVANEVSASFSRECLKAQAVAAYSYVKYHNDRGLVPTVLVKENVPDEIRSAVTEVWGQACYYNGSVAQTVYTASTSGYTADAQHVWGGSAVPYLISQECPFDVDYDPNYGCTKTYTEDEMRAKLEKYIGVTLSDDPENWLAVTEYEDGNYVKTVMVDGQYSINGRQMREGVLGYALKSAAFTVSYSDGVFTFTTYGYGHGVGMSQNGANILAKQGYSYVDILNFYFPGTYVQ